MTRTDRKTVSGVNSIRRRLLAWLVGVTTLAWAAFVPWSFWDTREDIGEMFDARLVQFAELLLSLIAHERGELEHSGGTGETVVAVVEDLVSQFDDEHELRRKVAFQIEVGNGRQFYRSQAAPTQRFTGRPNAFSEGDYAGEVWRVFTATDGDEIVVHVAETLDVRGHLINDFTLQLIGPLFVLLPSMALLIWFGVGRALQPIDRLAQRVALRDPDRLDGLSIESTPVEVRPLVEALNRLFLRLGAAFERERRFTADAAHELRTPLAAMRTQAQVARRTADASQRNHALERLQDAADRTARLVEQLLTLARVDETTIERDHEIDLAAIARAVCMDSDPNGTTKAHELVCSADDPVFVRANADLANVVVRNLVDNALRYTPDGGRVHVRVSNGSAYGVLHVDDSGPGIEPDQRSDAFARFHRLQRRSGGGAGLGLSIVRRIVEHHGGRVELGTSGLGGLRVSVTWPRGQAGAVRGNAGLS
ncbi:MAG: sensor histidine kinase N-terminal domain-containing protein [Chromatiales bacterium]|nr:sensor histidine kinase N-terminal domain-containing protein [Chromatiales bacterium]